MKSLHAQGKYIVGDLLTQKAYAKLIDGYYNIFKESITAGIKDGEIAKETLEKLESDAFLFSKLRSHAALVEAGTKIIDAKGKTKTWSAFLEDVKKLGVKYNENYLEAEYIFATSSAQMAANWQEIEKDGDDYDLQYRTAADDKVRESHAVLHNVTLPPTDPFWSKYYPPNGWRCRCVAVQVRKGKYEQTDAKKANKAGEKATTKLNKSGKNTLEIFRFNPGKEKILFPPKHPYRKVINAVKIIKDHKD